MIKPIQDFLIRRQQEHEQRLIDFDAFQIGDKVRNNTVTGCVTETIIKIDKQNDEIVSRSPKGCLESHLSSRSFLYGGYVKLED